MNNSFDELAKNLDQSATRRAALKKFGVGLAGVVLATLGLANKAEVDTKPKPPCDCKNAPSLGCVTGANYDFQYCVFYCSGVCAQNKHSHCC